MTVNDKVMKPNPEIQAKADKWERTAILLKDDESLILQEFCKKLPNESDHAFASRKDYFICHFINVINDLINAQISAVFRQGVRIEVDSDKSLMHGFIDNVSNSVSNVVPFKSFLQDFIAPSLKAYGTTFCIVDKPHIDTDNRQVELSNGKPYLILLAPSDVLNWCVYTDELHWFSYRSFEMLDPESSSEDPVTQKQSIQEVEVVHVLTKDAHYRLSEDGGIITKIEHNYGFVPVVIEGMYKLTPTSVLGNSSIDQTSKMIINANINLHLANYEVMKNGNSLLLMPEDSRTGKNRDIDIEGNTEIKKQDNDTVLEYAGEKPPEYLIKDLATDEQMKIAEFYFKAATDNEKNQKSVAKKGSSGQQVQESGFAKMVELQPIENNLIALATAIEQNAIKILDMSAKTIDIENDAMIEFNKKYDLRTVKQMHEDLSLAITNEIKQVSLTAFKTMHKQISNKMFTDPDVNKEVMKEIDDYTPMETDEDLDKFEKDLE